MGKMKFVEENSADAQNEAAAQAQAGLENNHVLSIPAHSEAHDQSQSQLMETVQIADFEASELSAEVEKMISEMRREVLSNRKRNMIWLIGAVAMCIPFFYLDRLLDFIAFLSPDATQKLFQFNHIVLALSLVNILLITPIRELRRRNKRFARLFERSMERMEKPCKIEEISDLRLVEPLTEVLAIDSVPVRNMAKANLTRLLPLLKASDADLLNASQRKQLNHFVSPRLYEFGYRDIRELWSKRVRARDTYFQLAILTAYEQVGSEDCLPAVQSLAHPSPAYIKIVPPEVVEEAQRCLTFLEMAVEKETISKQLLRPSSASEVMPGTLLRPAMPQPTKVESEALLRAANMPNE